MPSIEQAYWTPPFFADGRRVNRFAAFTVKGHCLGRRVPAGSILIIDAHADIRFGDIVVMEALDGVERGAKIFIGPIKDAFEVAMLDPPEVLRASLPKLNFACRVRAITGRPWMVPIIKACIRLRSTAYSDRLGHLVAKAEGKEIVCRKQ